MFLSVTLRKEETMLLILLMLMSYKVRGHQHSLAFVLKEKEPRECSSEQFTELTVRNHHGKAQEMIAVVFEGKFAVMEPSACFRGLGLQSGFLLMKLMEDDQKIFRSEAVRQHIMNVASSCILIKVSPAVPIHKAFV